MENESPQSEAEDDAKEGVLDETVEGDETAPRDIRYSITSYGSDPLVDGLVKRLNDGDIYIPPFQRKFVWKKPQASRFIESLLLGLPVPGIFLARDSGSSKQLVVDGQQRLQSLRMFYEGLYKQTDESKGEEFTLSGVGSRFGGRTYKTLDQEDRRALDNAILHATIVKQDSPPGDDSSIYQIFERLNTGGTLLHPQEIRACVSHGPFNDLLEKLNRFQPWRDIYGPVSRRMKDRELILRFFTLMYPSEPYKRPMKEALNKHMARNRTLTIVSGDILTKIFEDTISAISGALGRQAFRPAHALNVAVFDAVMVGVARRLQGSPRPLSVELQGRYFALMKDIDFQRAFERSTADEKQVAERLRIATQDLGAGSP